MPFAFRCFFTHSALLVLTSGLLTNCSSPSPATTANPPTPPAAASPLAARVDSLNGIPGHQFGEPLSAFPGLALNPNQGPGPRMYTYPSGKPEAGWFGKRKKEAPNEFYTSYLFAEGKFVGFSAVAYGDLRKALKEEAAYLFGPGSARTNGTLWEGSAAVAWYTQPTQLLGPTDRLDVQSQAFVRAQATAAADRLKAENAH